MIKFICAFCRDNVDHATFIGNPAITCGGFYVCDNCKKITLNNPIVTYEISIENFGRENSNV